ncbi:MAG: hypothetical protein JWM95_3772 [Gemmatimonadetes bacterium]|nr:hypothetical protein [Gemmatimonadota bacterium]
MRAHSAWKDSRADWGAVALRLRAHSPPGKLNFMCRMMFAAVAATLMTSSLGAQQVPGRDLYQFPVGTLAEAPALASAAGGGFWNPATIALAASDKLLFSASALNSSHDQGVSSELATLAVRLRGGITAGASMAMSGLSELIRTDTDPQSIGDAIPYSSMVLSAVLAAERGPATLGIALRRRSGTVDLSSGRVRSVDVGAVLNRPAGLPFRAAVSSFLLSPARNLERATGVAAAEAFLPITKNDLRVGFSYQLDEGGGDDRYLYGSGRIGMLDLRGGMAQQNAFGSTTTRMRLGLGLHYHRYIVGVASEDGTAGLGPTYQFLLTTVIPSIKQ